MEHLKVSTKDFKRVLALTMCLNVHEGYLVLSILCSFLEVVTEMNATPWPESITHMKSEVRSAVDSEQRPTHQ